MIKIIRYYLILLIIPFNLNSQENLEKWFFVMTDDFFEIMEIDKMIQLENKLTLFVNDKFVIFISYPSLTLFLKTSNVDGVHKNFYM